MVCGVNATSKNSITKFLSYLFSWPIGKMGFSSKTHRLLFEFLVKVPTYFANILYNQLRALHSR